MLKYVWIVMIVIPYIIWSIDSIKDIRRCSELNPLLQDLLLEESTKQWLVVTISAIAIALFFVCSISFLNFLDFFGL